MRCEICPRKCGADRSVHPGPCGGGMTPRVAKAMIHRWEEPCISGRNGTGAVFFSGCVLKCCYCQNWKISAENNGKEIRVEELANIYLRLQEQGADSIDLISAAQYLPWVRESLLLVRGKLHIPVIYNTGGYEDAVQLRQLEGLIDIYLPDFKYADRQRALRYSKAADYFEVTAAAIREMYRQVGKVEIGADGLMKRGVMIRHLVLPGGKEDSKRIMEWIAAEFPAGDVWVSLMRQYVPCYKAEKGDAYPELKRRITTLEYERVSERMIDLGLTAGYLQEKESADSGYTPDFDGSGI